MKKIIILLAIVLFTINASAQQTKPVAKETTKKESCCAKHDANAKAMSSEEIAKCQAKCKAEGKKCTAEEMAKCSSATKKCSPEEMAKCKKDEKKCCAKK